MIEASVKLCFIQQKSYSTTTQEKIEAFRKQLASPSISVKKDIDLYLLPAELKEEFIEGVGRLYGDCCRYVHLSPDQLQRRISQVDAGYTSGREHPNEIIELNLFVSRGLAAVLVLLYHCVPSWVAGDWLVQRDGSTIPWYFTQSKFIAAIDSSFDYKAERQSNLAHIARNRDENIRF